MLPSYTPTRIPTPSLNSTTVVPHSICPHSVNGSSISRTLHPNQYVLPNGKTKSRVLLKNVLYVPTMKVTLVSIGKLATAGYVALFRDNSNGLYRTRNQYSTPFAAAAEAPEELTMGELHARLSHIGTATIRDMVMKGMVTGVKLNPEHSSMDQCESCEYGKATRKPMCGAHHPPKWQGRKATTAHSQMIIPAIQVSISWLQNLTPMTPIASMKPG